MNKSISNYSQKALKKNKLKMILIVLAIALSAFLVNTLGTLAVTLKQENIEQTKINYGSDHAIFFNISDENYDILRKHTMIKGAGEINLIRDKRYKADNKIDADMCYIPKEYNEYFNFKPEKGRMCENKDEVLISQEMSTKLNKTVDDYISLDNKQYKISGIAARNNAVELNGMTIFVSEEYFNSISSKSKSSAAYVQLKSEKNIKSDIDSIRKDLNINEKNVQLNINLINSLDSGSENFIPIAVVSFIILLTAVISIYNIFNISVKERTREFGLLLSLGATKSNIKSILRKEAFIECIRGIPIGLIISIFVSYIVIPGIATGHDLKVKMDPLIMLITIAVVAISVFISARLSSRTACRISPLAAINYVEGKTTIGRKDTKSEDVVNVSRLSRINLFRNRKRTIVTILSITMSLILFIVVSTIISSMNMERLADSIMGGDYEISANMYNRIEDTLLDDKDAENIKSVNGVNDVYTIKLCFVSANNIASSTLAAYSDNLLTKFVKNPISGKLDVEKLSKDNGVIVVKDSRHEKEMPKVGDKLVISDEDRKKEFTVQAIVDKEAWKNDYSSMGFILITSKEAFEKNFGVLRNTKVIVDVNKGENKDIETYLKKYKSMDSLVVKSKSDELVKLKKEHYSIELIGYSFVVIIAIIGFINFINTTITNIISRRRELAVLESIGLTRKSVNSLINKESLYYILISGGLGMIIGIPLSYLLFTLFKKEATYAQYTLPIIPILIIILIMLMLQWICVKITHNKISKGSIIDNVRFN